MKKYLSILIITVIVSVAPFLLFAATGTTGNSQGTTGDSKTSIPIEITNPFKQKSIPDLINLLIDSVILPIGGVIAVLMVMWAGFLFVTAQGKEAQITKARESLKWAVIGAAILLGARVISEVITSTINEIKI